MLDSMPAGWQQTTLGEVLILQYGSSLTKEKRLAGEFPVYGSAGIVDFHNKPLVRNRSIVVGRKGSVGTVFLTDGPFFPIDTTYYVEPKIDVNWTWLKELLVWLDMVKLNEATGVPGLNRERAYSTSIPLPPLAEQGRIAEILSSVDDSIRATELVIAQGEFLKRGLMANLLTGGLGSAAIALGEVPEDWTVTDLKKVLDKVIDYRGKAPPKAPSGVRLITARNVRKGYISFEHEEYIDEGAYEAWMNRGLPKPDDVMFTTEAPLGNVALFPNEGTFALGQRIVTLQCSSLIEPHYLFYFLLSPFAEKQIVEKATGSTALGIKSKELVKLIVPVPPLDEQKRIAQILRICDLQIEANQKAKNQLQRLKRGLMDDLLSGRVRTV